MYEIADGKVSLTAEAMQWLRDGKLRHRTENVYDPTTGMVADMMYMGLEPCDPEVADILAKRAALKTEA
jgi:hypothetical protein